MRNQFLRTLSSPAVLAEQERAYGRSQVPAASNFPQPLGAEELFFLGQRDSFYLASVGEDGWPYVQHRGGPPGFVRVVSPTQIAFGDFNGNRQLISAGNIRTRRRVALFFMDYAARERLKLLGEATILSPAEAEQAGIVVTAPPRTNIERVFRVDLMGFDWNCPKYITPRFTGAEVEDITRPLQARIAELERALAKPRQEPSNQNPDQ